MKTSADVFDGRADKALSAHIAMIKIALLGLGPARALKKKFLSLRFSS